MSLLSELKTFKLVRLVRCDIKRSERERVIEQVTRKVLGQ